MCKNSTSIITDFVEGIFSLQTRRFGTVAELIMLEKYGLSDKTSNQHYDATDNENNKIEIKFSRVLRSNNKQITKKNILAETVYSSMYKRAISSKDYKKIAFDSNIQQVKRTEFDFLYYGLFFKDKIAIFKIKSTDVENIEGYSDFQHKGNKGEGQFHINNDTIDYHMKNHFLEWITYEEVYEMFEANQY